MRYLLFVTTVLLAQVSMAEWAEKFPVGSSFPPIEAEDQHGKKWDRSGLLAKEGLVFLFNRSTTW
ncbi:MAG: hypothetical protein CMQ20_02165 [Gammaproteobacteria bacterium]|jgi:hypothetical protein|nr:hypothetical protein [Gammaproteobacteria bacterium]|tara:strand:- start:699 stop:893 length:195 start_codon:yes stop_codon:yes gene_type:complete